MATLFWTTGLEYGLAVPVYFGGGLCNGIYGSTAVQSAIKRTGEYALECSSTSSFITKNIPGSPEYVVGTFYIYIHTEPSAWVYCFQISHTSSFSLGYNPTSNNIFCQITGGSAVYSQEISLGTWYRVDVRAYCGATTWTVDWRVDEIDQTQATATGKSATTFNGREVRVGSPSALAWTVYYDDVAFSTESGDYPIGGDGGVSVIGLRPNADGTHNNTTDTMEDSAGNDIDGSTYYAYDKLDENPFVTTPDSDYVRQATVGETRYCEINFADIDKTAILGVQGILQYCQSFYDSCSGATIVLDSDDQQTEIYGTPSSPANMTTTAATAWYRSAVIATPSGGWTQAYVNSLIARFGYSTGLPPYPYWLAMMLEVAYSPISGYVQRIIGPF